MSPKMPRSSRQMKPSSVEKSESSTSVLNDVQAIVSEMDALKEKKKLIEERESELKVKLGDILEKSGAKDSKGSYAIILGDRVAKKEARKTIKLDNEKAESLFKKKKIWKEVIEVKEVINESYVEQAVLNKKITQDELESVCDIKTNYAIVVREYKPEEEMPEIEVTKRSK